MNRRGIVIAGLVTLLAGCGASEDEEVSEVTDSAATAPLAAEPEPTLSRIDAAYEFCITQITDQLQAPATAQFSERTEATGGAINETTFIFTGTVDAENQYGALLRSDWGCEIGWDGTSFVANQAVIESR